MVHAATMAGEFLPPQVIYAGKTPRCLPSTKFPKEWNITYTLNHWANEKTTEAHIKNVLVPYIKGCRKRLSLQSDHSALVIFDKFRGLCTPNILSLLQNHHIQFVIVPSNCTDHLQPLDVCVNKAMKDFLRKKFHDWHSTKVSTGINKQVDLSTSVMNHWELNG